MIISDFTERSILNVFLSFILGTMIGLGLLYVVDSFLQHMTPDASVYLLHARTFVRNLNRFTLSHDSKGIILTFILAPMVRMFGPTMAAAASAQLFAYILALFFFYRLTRRYLELFPSLILGLIWLTSMFSPFVWGGNSRPEDFAAVMCIVALYGSLQDRTAWRVIGGGAASLCAFIKFSLMITPLGITVVSAVISSLKSSEGRELKKFSRSLLKNLALVFIGFFAVASVLILWIVIFDDPAGWYRQTIEWPFQYKGGGFKIATIVDVWKTFSGTRMVFLFFAAVAGAVFGYLKGQRRLSLLCMVFLILEFFRITMESTRWAYLFAVMISVLMISTSFLGIVKNKRLSLILPWFIPLFLMMNVQYKTFRQKLKALELRGFRSLPSPYEVLAERMRPYYQKGERIFIDSNDYQLILFLDAPAPPPILPLHYNLVSEEEKKDLLNQYKNHPPDWVVKKRMEKSGPGYRIIGDVDGPYHIYNAATDTTVNIINAEEVVECGKELSEQLPESEMYRLTVDIGYLQCWHLIKKSPLY